MIEWTPEAIEIYDADVDIAWKRYYFDGSDWGSREAMREALRLVVSYKVSEARAEAFEEAAAFVEGKGCVIPGASVFAPLVSRNNQPCMSGDARDRLHPHDRRKFDDAVMCLAAAIRALAKEPPK